MDGSTARAARWNGSMGTVLEDVTSETIDAQHMSIRAGILGRKRHEASASTIRMAGRRRSARDVQVLAGIESRQPGDCRAVLPLRTPQLVELLEVEPELARSPEEAPQAPAVLRPPWIQVLFTDIERHRSARIVRGSLPLRFRLSGGPSCRDGGRTWFRVENRQFDPVRDSGQRRKHACDSQWCLPMTNGARQRETDGGPDWDGATIGIRCLTSKSTIANASA